MISKMQIVPIRPALAAIIRNCVTFAEIPMAQRTSRDVLNKALAAAKPDSSGPWLTLFRPPESGTMDYAPGVFVPDGFEPGEEAISLFSLPQGSAAHLRLEGPYEELPQAWQDLFSACKSQGLELAGLNWEVYTETSPQPVTDLYAWLA
ncbi:MAG: AraC family transcriptional regulator [Alphaproteobacteria bacterium]|nr:AraC family transcriptional regulator [Alphaproteobacteria bacterium]